MASDIDANVPPLGAATTAGVRANFLAAKNEIEALQGAVGFANYEDTATAGTPISLTANTWTNLTNNGLGARTVDKLPASVGTLWNTSTNRFSFTDLPLYTQLTGRFDLTVVTTTANQLVDVQALVAIGSASEYEFPLVTQMYFKTAGTHQINIYNGMFIGSNDVKLNPCALRIRSDASATAKVAGWYVAVQFPVTD